MIQHQVNPIIQILADGMDSFDLYYMDNRDQWQDILFRRGYNKFGLGGEEQYENERIFAEYPGETLFYHLVMVKDAISPQLKLTKFLPNKPTKENR